MKESGVRFLWQVRESCSAFRCAVALHGHTLHSRELLTFLDGILERHSILRRAVRWQRRIHPGAPAAIDFSRLWWTPPLAPLAAWDLERRQIEDELDAAALVSLTDHDNIDAPLALRVLDRTSEAPISFEWTVPRHGTYFHLGVHNLPPARASELFREAQDYTATRRTGRFEEILAAMATAPGALVVLNHPLWDEAGIGTEAHRRALEALTSECGGFLHAVEMNGFRSWQENCEVAELARALGIAAVSGGDRHGRQPASVLNLTNASSFAEFAAEVRGGFSQVAILPSYLEHRTLRVAHTIGEILREDPEHALGATRWNDRVFFRRDDGTVVPLSQLWAAGRAPAMVSRFVGLMSVLDSCLRQPGVRSALRVAFASKAEVTA